MRLKREWKGGEILLLQLTHFKSDAAEDTSQKWQLHGSQDGKTHKPANIDRFLCFQDQQIRKDLYLTKKNCRWEHTTQLPIGLDETGPEKKIIKVGTLNAPDVTGEDVEEGLDTHLLLQLTHFNW